MARFSDLSEGVLEEIMSWLPPESLREFKLVHRSWYLRINDLMDNPAFVAKHLRNMKKTRTMVPVSRCQISYLIAVEVGNEPERTVGDGGDEDVMLKSLLVLANDYHSGKDYIPCRADDPRFRNFKFTSDCYYFKMVSQCDGIIFLSTFYGGTDYLMNPALKEMKIIPSSYCAYEYRLRGMGFGYDSRTCEYKVVSFMAIPLNDLFDGPYKAEVYSLQTNHWREVKCDIRTPRFDRCHEVLYCNGASYWTYWDGVVKMISFDFSDEVFRDVPLPAGIRVPNEDWEEDIVEWSKLCVWKESLVLFIYDPYVDSHSPQLIDMWVLGSKPGSIGGSYSWTKHVTIGPLDGIRCPLGFWDDVELFLEDEYGKTKLFNLASKTLSHFSEPSFFYSLVIYQKSLVSVLKKGRRSVLQP